MKQLPLRVHRGTGGIAALLRRGVPTPNDRRAFPLLAATLVAWACALACPPAAGQQLPAGGRPTLVDAPGRGAARPTCPSLVDGQGGRVRSRGTGGAAEASFARDCPAAIANTGPVVQGNPAKRSAPGLTVPGLAAGSVQADLPAAYDPRNPPPLVVRVTPERLSATVLTGGTTLWLLQSGFWTYLLILGLPLWRHVDLLPIVDRASDDDARASDTAGAEEERAVARVLRGLGRSRGKRGARR